MLFENLINLFAGFIWWGYKTILYCCYKYIYNNVKKISNYIIYFYVSNFLCLYKLLEIFIVYLYTSFWFYILDKNIKVSFLQFFLERTLFIFFIIFWVSFVLALFLFLKENIKLTSIFLHVLSVLVPLFFVFGLNTASAGENIVVAEVSTPKPLSEAYKAALHNDLEGFNSITSKHKLGLIVSNAVPLNVKNPDQNSHSFIHQVTIAATQNLEDGFFPAAIRPVARDEVVYISTADYLNQTDAMFFVNNNKAPLIYKSSVFGVYVITNSSNETAQLNPICQHVLNNHLYDEKYFRQCSSLNNLALGDAFNTDYNLNVRSSTEFKTVYKGFSFSNVPEMFETKFKKSFPVDKSLLDFENKTLHYKKFNSNSFQSYDLTKIEINDNYLINQFKTGQSIVTKRVNHLSLQTNLVTHNIFNIFRSIKKI